MKYSYWLATIMVMLSSCYFSEEVSPDDSPWNYALPSQKGLDEELLAVLDLRIKNGVFDNITGIVAIRGNELIYENYYDGSTRNDKINLDGVSMSVLSVLVGVAVTNGLIEDIDAPIQNYYTGTEASLMGDDVLRQRISIRDLLLMRSGISWNESATSIFNPDNNINELQRSPNWLEYIFLQEMEALPGLRYAYNSGHGVIIADILQNVSGLSLDEFAREFLFTPLGITDWEWQRDAAQNYNGGFGLSISVFDLTKIGFLMANNGVWDGRRILSPEWVALSTTTQFAVDRFNDFSYSWWTFSEFSSVARVMRENDAYYAEGYGGQYLFVVPHAQLVVAIAADNYFRNRFSALLIFRDYFIRSVNQE